MTVVCIRGALTALGMVINTVYAKMLNHLLRILPQSIPEEIEGVSIPSDLYILHKVVMTN